MVREANIGDTKNKPAPGAAVINACENQTPKRKNYSTKENADQAQGEAQVISRIEAAHNTSKGTTKASAMATRAGKMTSTSHNLHSQVGLQKASAFAKYHLATLRKHTLGTDCKFLRQDGEKIEREMRTERVALMVRALAEKIRCIHISSIIPSADSVGSTTQALLSVICKSL